MASVRSRYSTNFCSQGILSRLGADESKVSLFLTAFGTPDTRRLHVLAWTPSSRSRLLCHPADLQAAQDFCKPVADMGMLNIHGPTITGTESEESRRYRRITTEAFGTKTYRETWRESVMQAGRLFGRLEALKDKCTLSRQLEILTLDVVGKVCLGRILRRNTAKATPNSIGVFCSSSSASPYQTAGQKRHQLTYREAFGTSANHMGSIYLMPRHLLSMTFQTSPFNFTRNTDSVFATSYASKGLEILSRVALVYGGDG
jgi:hypothetical protein